MARLTRKPPESLASAAGNRATGQGKGERDVQDGAAGDIAATPRGVPAGGGGAPPGGEIAREPRRKVPPAGGHEAGARTVRGPLHSDGAGPIVPRRPPDSPLPLLRGRQGPTQEQEPLDGE